MSENENSALGKCCCWVFGVQVPFPFFLIPGTHRRIIASQVVLVVKSLPENSGDIRDAGLIPGSGRPPGEGHDNPLQYSCWRIPWTEEPGGLWSIGSQSQTRLKGWSAQRRILLLSVENPPLVSHCLQSAVTPVLSWCTSPVHSAPCPPLPSPQAALSLFTLHRLQGLLPVPPDELLSVWEPAHLSGSSCFPGSRLFLL